MTNIRWLVDVSYEYAKGKGFWSARTTDMDKRIFAAYKLGLVAGEAHEAIDALRKNKDWKEPVGLELADVVIRAADFCGAYGIDLEEMISTVQERSKARPALHGKFA